MEYFNRNGLPTDVAESGRRIAQAGFKTGAKVGQKLSDFIDNCIDDFIG